MTATPLGSLDGHRKWVDRVFASGRVPHGILLAGPPGSGKFTLALEIARRYICQAQASRPCDLCLACRETARLNYPDLVIFSSRDNGPEIRALASLAPLVTGTREGRATFAKALEDLFFRILNRHGGGFFKAKELKSSKKEPEPITLDWLNERLEGLDETTVEKAGDLFSGLLEDLAEIDQRQNHKILPLSGIQEIIRLLARRPLLGERRVVIIEGIQTFRQEGANAFLKTLEEPPPGNLLIMISNDLTTVLPTIRSRAAVLNFRRPGSSLLKKIAQERYACQNPSELAGVNGLWDYLERQAEGSSETRRDLTRFLELIRLADQDPGVIEFCHELEKRGHAQSFLRVLASLIADNLVASETGIGKERLEALALSHYRPGFLRQMIQTIEELARGISSNNLSTSQGLLALIMRFWLEERRV